MSGSHQIYGVTTQNTALFMWLVFAAQPKDLPPPSLKNANGTKFWYRFAVRNSVSLFKLHSNTFFPHRGPQSCAVFSRPQLQISVGDPAILTDIVLIFLSRITQIPRIIRKFKEVRQLSFRYRGRHGNLTVSKPVPIYKRQVSLPDAILKHVDL